MLKIMVEDNFPEIPPDLFGEALQDVRDYMYESVLWNFSVGGRPETWAALMTGEPATLFRSGTLFHSITPESGDDFAEVSTDVFYARFLQLGTKFMVARPFMMFQEEDIDWIKDRLAGAIISLFQTTEYNKKGS